MIGVFPLLFFLVQIQEVFSTPCAQRFYPSLFETRIVCVCNATYCDEYEDTPLTTGTAQIFSSSEGGDRMNSRSAPVLNGYQGSWLSARISVNPAVTYQEIIGFGGAFTDAAGINIASLSAPTQERLMQSMYGTKGARYSIGRVPMAGNDFSTTIYSYDDHPGDVNMSQFALADADLKYKIPYITRARNLTGGDLRLFSSPWSAPAWMKTTGIMQGWGSLRAGLDAAWAKYFVRFFEEYLAHGISFWATTVQNEPSTGALPFWRWQTMYWSAKGEKNFVAQYLGPALAASNASKSVKIIGLDDQRVFLPVFAYEAYSDPASSKYYAGMGLHWYFDSVAPALSMSAVHAAYPDKFILYTEACAGWVPLIQGPVLGEWQRAESYASSIIEDLNNFVAGWTDWNIALNLQGGPTWVPNYVDSPILVNATADEFYKQPTHYAMTHFSRFLRPGARRVQSSISGIDAIGVEHTTFIEPDGQRILTVLNTAPFAKEVIIEETDGTSIKANVSPKSITSVIWKK